MSFMSQLLAAFIIFGVVTTLSIGLILLFLFKDKRGNGTPSHRHNSGSSV